MSIPDLNQHGFLPAGIHDATRSELQQRFGAEGSRALLWGRFEAFLLWLAEKDVAEHLMIGGSFVTSKSVPADVDVVIDLSNPKLG